MPISPLTNHSISEQIRRPGDNDVCAGLDIICINVVPVLLLPCRSSEEVSAAEAVRLSLRDYRLQQRVSERASIVLFRLNHGLVLCVLHRFNGGMEAHLVRRSGPLQLRRSRMYHTGFQAPVGIEPNSRLHQVIFYVYYTLTSVGWWLVIAGNLFLMVVCRVDMKHAFVIKGHMLKLKYILQVCYKSHANPF